MKSSINIKKIFIYILLNITLLIQLLPISVVSAAGCTGFTDATACRTGGCFWDAGSNSCLAGSSGYLPSTGENAPAQAQCVAAGGIWIAIGCVDTTPTGILTRLVQTGLGVMSGVALFQLIQAGIMYQRGDQGKIQEAQSKVISTITGIGVLIFSVLILEVLGVNILDVLPGGFIQ